MESFTFVVSVSSERRMPYDNNTMTRMVWRALEKAADAINDRLPAGVHIVSIEPTQLQETHD